MRKRHNQGNALIVLATLALSLMVPTGCGDDDGGSVANHAPVIVPPGNLTADIGDPLSVSLSASDPDGDVVTLQLVAGPVGATLAGEVLTFTPSASDVGTHDVVLAATDSGAPPLTAYATFTITVPGPTVDDNHPPVLLPIGEHAVLLGDTLQLTLDATDPDGDNVSFDAPAAPASLSITGNQLSWTPVAGDAGQSFWIVISASDDGSPAFTTYTGFTVRVMDPDAPGPNHAPVIYPLPEQSVLASQALSFQVTGADPDGDGLAWQADALPAGATFAPATGSFDWTPTAADEGTHHAIFRLTDDGTPALYDTLLVTIRVSVPGSGNLPPAWTTWPASAQFPSCGTSTSSATFEASDPEGGVISYTGSGLPAGATLTPQGTAVVLDLTISNWAIGLHTFLLSAQDDGVPAAAVTGAYRVEILPPAPVPFDFTNLGTFSTPSLDMGSFTVAGSADVNVLNLNGLGIVGGTSTNSLDSTEWMELTFVEPAYAVRYFVPSAGNGDGDGLVGEATLEAWDETNAYLGAVLVDGAGWKVVSDTFGGAMISRFRVSAKDGDSQRIGSLDAGVCP